MIFGFEEVMLGRNHMLLRHGDFGERAVGC